MRPTDRTLRRVVVVLLATLLCPPGSHAQAAGPSPSPAPALATGDKVPAFDAEGIDGVAKHVAFPAKSSTVLLFFLSSCPVCHRMIPLWNDAYSRRPRQLQVVGVLLDRESPEFFTMTPIQFPVVRSPGRSVLDAYKINHVPVTLRVGPGGRVEDLGQGTLDGIRLGEIFRP